MYNLKYFILICIICALQFTYGLKYSASLFKKCFFVWAYKLLWGLNLGNKSVLFFLVISVLFVLFVSCGSKYKMEDFLEAGKNDGRFLFVNGEAQAAYDYLSIYRKENNIKKFEYSTDKRYVANIARKSNLQSIYMDAKVNNLTMRFYIDTGELFSGLSYAGAKILGKDYDNYTYNPELKDDFAYFPESFEFANVKCNYPVFNSAVLNGNVGALGLIGVYDLFNESKTLCLDCINNRLIYNGSLPEGNPVPFYINYNGYSLVIPVKIKNKTYMALLNTASSLTEVFVELENAAVLNESFTLDVYRLTGIVKDESSYILLDELTVGDATLNDLKFIYTKDGGTWYSNNGSVDMVLGGDFFYHTKLTFDIVNRLCYIQKAQKDKK